MVLYLSSEQWSEERQGILDYCVALSRVSCEHFFRRGGVL